MSRKKQIEQPVAEAVEVEPTETGNILVKRDLSTGRVKFAWRGGDSAKLSNVVLARALPAYVKRTGEILRVGPFCARVVKEDANYVWVERVYEVKS